MATLRQRLSGHEPARGQRSPYPHDRFLDALAIGTDDNVGRLGRLVWIRYAGEVQDLAGERPLVEALHVALDEHLDRAFDVNFHEVGAVALDVPAHLGADVA